jgi:signal transduction histidine kinase
MMDDLSGQSAAADESQPAAPVTSADVREALARAQRDWDNTADSLTQLVCLVDDYGRVLRVNRVVETWQLGRVSEVLGQDLHSLLHAHRCSGNCTLAGMLGAAWTSSELDLPDEFELFDNQLERAIAVSLRPIAADGQRAAGDSARAVVVITDVTPLRLARLALERLNEQLEKRVCERTAQLQSANRGLQNEVARREAAESALRLARNEQELLSQQLIQAQEMERRRIARELHDSVGQSLSAIKYSLERTEELLRKGRPPDAHALLARIIARVRDSMKEIRSIAMDLRPSVLDDLGVASALEWLSREFAETYEHIAISTQITATDADIPMRLVTTVFRCAQELLNNVAKHSRARHVAIALLRDEIGITLLVCDDGVGLPAADSSGSFGRGHGIRNLRERAQMTGGRISLTPDSPGGTRAQVQWPLATTDLNSQL